MFVPTVPNDAAAKSAANSFRITTPPRPTRRPGLSERTSDYASGRSAHAAVREARPEIRLPSRCAARTGNDPVSAPAVGRVPDGPDWEFRANPRYTELMS